MKPSLIHEALISLIEARCTLSSPEKWGQGQYAKDKDGKPIGADDATACKYCFQGALWHSCLDRNVNKKQKLSPAMIGDFAVSDIVDKATSYCLKHLPPDPRFFYSDSSRMISFNDFTATHIGLLNVIDLAIKDAKKDFDTEYTNNT